MESVLNPAITTPSKEAPFALTLDDISNIKSLSGAADLESFLSSK